MTSLATIKDLKQYLQLAEGDNARDRMFQRALDLGSEWVRGRSRQDYDGSAARTERGLFRGPRTIRLRHLPVASITTIKVGAAGDAPSDMTTLEATDWTLLDSDTGKLHVRHRTTGREADVVEIAYQGGQTPTSSAREACVLVAAFLANSAPQVAGGLDSIKAFEIDQRFLRDLPPEALWLVPARTRSMWA